MPDEDDFDDDLNEGHGLLEVGARLETLAIEAQIVRGGATLWLELGEEGFVRELAALESSPP